jgi:hypothetical protein
MFKEIEYLVCFKYCLQTVRRNVSVTNLITKNNQCSMSKFILHIFRLDNIHSFKIRIHQSRFTTSMKENFFFIGLV